MLALKSSISCGQSVLSGTLNRKCNKPFTLLPPGNYNFKADGNYDIFFMIDVSLLNFWGISYAHLC